MTKVLNQPVSHGTWAPFGAKGDDPWIVPIPPNEVFDRCVLTIEGQRLNAGASIRSQPSTGQTGVGNVTVHWWYDGCSEIDYRIEAYTRPPNAASGVSVRVPGFKASTCGFQFSNNDFPDRPDIVIPTPFGNMELGSASNGLCGGMVYAVRDYFEGHLPVPAGTAPPESGPLFDFIVHRLFDSFNLPDGVLKYMELMNPALPDHETDMSKLNLAPHGRSWRMVVEEWPQIKADLDAGRLCPLALVLVKSADPGQLGKNHQVMAYGYDLVGTNLTMRIYDPNSPGDDTVTLTIDLAEPEHTKQVACNGNQVFSFFRTRYGYEAPPGAQGGPAVKAAIRALANHKLVCAEDAGAKPLIANRDQVGQWETFEIFIVGSNRIAMRSAANGKYVCAESAGSAPLIANRTQVGPWETFELHFQPGNNVALLSLANGKYVCAENAGAGSLIANRTQVGPWETFTTTAI